jgi:hypothetical protein
VTSEGSFRSTDWLAGGNLTWLAAEHLNARAAASRTLNRPDLTTCPRCRRWTSPAIASASATRTWCARIENYDRASRAFPGIGEVLAAGVFYKQLHHPIEPALFGTNGSSSASAPRTRRAAATSAASSSCAPAPRPSHLAAQALVAQFQLLGHLVQDPHRADHERGITEHPLVGQAPFLLNPGLTYTSPSAHTWSSPCSRPRWPAAERAQHDAGQRRR